MENSAIGFDLSPSIDSIRCPLMEKDEAGHSATGARFSLLA
jgi:hypothetical protein